MENRKKKNLLATGIYIIISFCFLIFLGLGIFASLRAAFTQPPEEQISSPDTRAEDIKLAPVIPDIPQIAENNEVFEPELVPEEPIADIVEEPVIIEEKKYYFPVSGDVTKDFSKDVLVFSKTMNDYRTHAGVDIGCEYGQAVMSFTDGTVEEFYDDPLNGMTLVISHDDNIITRYCNLSSELPEGLGAGVAVSAGQNVAFVGDPGILECAEGYHLHFEVIKDGNYVAINDFNLEE
ncbi:MAG: M23 family metallopeptidase [Ruminococcaceae bacterium]|nr:M23 family metallopeptidase [Oscillospiraceae bacterium]